MSELSLEKVTCFCVRYIDGVEQLLLIKHPTAGFQVPAGSVEHGELPVDAASREVFEETGLGSDVIMSSRLIHIEQKRLSDADTFLLRYPSQAEPGDRYFRRGLPVEVVNDQIIYREWDFNTDPPRVTGTSTCAWSLGDCATSLNRYYYVFEVNPGGDRSWGVNADRHNWEVSWYSIPLKVDLISRQSHWMDVYHNTRQRTEEGAEWRE